MSPPSTAPPNSHVSHCPPASRATRCQRIVSRMEFMKGNDSGSSTVNPQRRIASKTKRKGSLTSSPQGTFITSPSADNTSNIQSVDSSHTPKKPRHGEVKRTSISSTESSNASTLRWMSGSEDCDDSENEIENENDSDSSTKPRCPSFNNGSGSETSSSKDEYTPSSSDESDSDVRIQLRSCR
jgi:hypothetical protein